MTRPAELADVCLAISSFHNDSAVIELIARVTSDGDHPFGSILVVDSLGSGAMPEAIRTRGWPRVDYVCFDENLGSAGNLAKRLELAAKTPCRFVYAVNHDGSVDVDVIHKLREVGATDARIAAAYPLRRMTGSGGAYDITGVLPVPVRSLRVKKPPRSRTLDVYWSSSNGALYSLEPSRRGLLPWADLWMGWEDLGYGWLLRQRGYRQLLVCTARSDDAYEYRRLSSGTWLSDKPSWYSYYYARNLLLAARRSHGPLLLQATVLGRVLSEFAVIAALRSEKRARLGFLSAGLRDALRGRSGKWRLP